MRDRPDLVIDGTYLSFTPNAGEGSLPDRARWFAPLAADKGEGE